MQNDDTKKMHGNEEVITDEMRDLYTQVAAGQETSEDDGGQDGDSDDAEKTPEEGGTGDGTKGEEPDGQDSESYEEEIPDRLVQAARRAHLTDEQIITLAQENPEALEAIASQQESAVKASSQREKPKDSDGDQSADPLANLQDLLKPVTIEGLDQYDKDFVSGVLTPLVDRINTQASAISQLASLVTKESSEPQDNGEAAALVREINGHLDTLVGTVPLLGTSATINDQQFELRRSIVQMADNIMRNFAATGVMLTRKQGLNRAVQALTGKTIVDPDEKKIFKITKQKRLLTTRPSSRKVSTPKHAGKNGDTAQAVDAVRDYVRKSQITALGG